MLAGINRLLALSSGGNLGQCARQEVFVFLQATCYRNPQQAAAATDLLLPISSLSLCSKLGATSSSRDI